MNVQDRANNILSLCDVDKNLLKPGVFDAVIAEISESEQEAYKKAASIYVTASNAYKEGFNAAKEKAKGIAETYITTALNWMKGTKIYHGICKGIADRIGEMSSTEEPEK